MRKTAKNKAYILHEWARKQLVRDRRKWQKQVARSIRQRKKEQLPNKENETPEKQSPKRPQMPYNSGWKIATLNCRDLNEQSKREQIIDIMHTHQIDFLALQETKINASSHECHTNEQSNVKYYFFFSSFNSLATPIPKAQANAKVRPRQPPTEHHGVGFVIGPKYYDCLKECVPHNGRIIEIKIANSGPDIFLIRHYAPHSGRPVAEKEKHWDNLQQILSTKTRQAPVILLGDTNAHIHGRVSDIEGSVVGRHVFGHGNHYVQELPEEQRENRQMLMDFCISNNLTISNTFSEKRIPENVHLKKQGRKALLPPGPLTDLHNLTPYLSRKNGGI